MTQSSGRKSTNDLLTVERQFFVDCVWDQSSALREWLTVNSRHLIGEARPSAEALIGMGVIEDQLRVAVVLFDCQWKTLVNCRGIATMFSSEPELLMHHTALSRFPQKDVPSRAFWRLATYSRRGSYLPDDLASRCQDILEASQKLANGICPTLNPELLDLAARAVRAIESRKKRVDLAAWAARLSDDVARGSD
jgi:hypothetical protein